MGETEITLEAVYQLLFEILKRLSGKQGGQWFARFNTMLSTPGINRLLDDIVEGSAADSNQPFQLTPRQIEVLQLVSMGHTNKVIAARLTMSTETVKMHVKNIIGKLHASGRTHAVTIAAQAGLLGRPLVSADSNQSFHLTPRETQVLQLVSMGNTNKMIAGRLSVTEDTVKKYVQNIIAKLHASDRTHATAIAARAGLLGEPLVSAGRE